MHDLLCDPLIGVLTLKGEKRMNLPELLASLSAGQVEGYTGLRAHQADPWHVFLVQLAASIQARQHTETLPTDATYWRRGLLDLADGKACAWHLLVDDVTQPAFMQHTWGSEAEASDYGVTIKRGQTSYDPKATTPDELDVLVTSKNHDVKMARVAAEEIEAWLFALVLLQTTSGFLGQGNYGIVRMNGGSASRPIVAWAESLNPSQRFVHEVACLTKLRDSTQATYGYAQRGVVLTWCYPWRRNGHQFYLSDLEPWFIEAARPIRLIRQPPGDIIALGATSKARQIGPKTLENGDVGDPWIPINISDKKKGRSALTLTADGFTPERLTELLFEQGFALTALQRPQAGKGPGWFVASCLVRGQGTTDGFHQAIIPVPPKARLMLSANRKSLEDLAQKLLSDAKDIQETLNTALIVLSKGGSDPEKADFDRVEEWLKAAKRDFGRRWDNLYFPTVWRGVEENHSTVRRDWQQRLVNEADALLTDAAQRLPLPANRTWRAITQAERAFYGRLRKHELPLPRRAPAQTLATMEDATL